MNAPNTLGGFVTSLIDKPWSCWKEILL